MLSSNCSGVSNSSNCSSGQPGMDFSEPHGLAWLRLAAYTVIFVFGVVGNFLVIQTIRRPLMKTVTNVFITNLAVADFVVCLFNVPMVTTLGHLGYWPFGEMMCKFLPFLQGVSLSASVGTLVAVAADRFKMIVLYKMPKTKLKQAYLAVAVIWLFSIALPFPLLLFSHIVQNAQGQDLCIEIWPDTTSRKTYTLLVAVFLYFIPLGAISVIYSLIIKKLWSLTESQKVSHQRQKRIVCMLVIVVVLFAICWLPYHIIFLFMDFGAPPITYTIIAAVLTTQWFIYSNSACNPIVYAVLNSNYRSEFARMLRCRENDVKRRKWVSVKRKGRHLQQKVSLTTSKDSGDLPGSHTATTAI